MDRSAPSVAGSAAGARCPGVPALAGGARRLGGRLTFPGGLPAAEIVGRTNEEVLGAKAYGMVRLHVEKALAGKEVAYEHALPLGDLGVLANWSGAL